MPDGTANNEVQGQVQAIKVLRDHALSLLQSVTGYYKSIKLTDTTVLSVNHIVNAAATFREDIKGALHARGITFDSFTRRLEIILISSVNKLVESIHLLKRAPGHAKRMEVVDKILDDVELTLMDLRTEFGIADEAVAAVFEAIRPHIHALVIEIGDINEPDHQQLLYSLIVLLFPQLQLLRPLLPLLGLRPLGPFKDLYAQAAWLQKYIGANSRVVELATNLTDKPSAKL